MIRPLLSFLFLCTALMNSAPLFSQSVLQQYDNQIVDRVEIFIHAKGEVTNDTGTIANLLLTKQGGIFSQAEFDEDLKSLSENYDRVDPTIDASGETVSVTIHLWPKPTLKAIHWKGNHYVKTSALQKELGISSFGVFERQAFNLAFHKLRAYYIKEGYFEAKLDYRVDFDLEENEVSITIDIVEGRSGKIQKIEFVGFTCDEEKAILGEMITKTFNRFTSWYTEAGIYHEDAVMQDRLVIINYLQNQGYADATVDIAVTESKKTNRIILTITADKGPLYTVGEITFDGNHILSDCKIDSLFDIRPGDPYSLEAIRDTIEEITNAYGRLGYIDAFVDFFPEQIEGECRYNIAFKIEEGEQFRVGLIRVFGNLTTKSSVILHETILIPGEIFNTMKLKATERRLLNIGYFKNVNVYIVKGTESSLLQGNYRDVFIEVEETSTGKFSAFAGYSTVEEIFGGVNITENNFNHEGLTTMFKKGLSVLRGGGEYLAFTAQIGQKSRNYTVSWTKPHFMDTKWSIGFDLSNSTSRYISKDYDLENTSLALRANYDVNPFVRWGLQYRLKNGFVNLSHEGKHIDDLEREANIHGLISAVGTSLSYDSTNHPVRPSSGFRSRLFFELAGPGGDHQFLSFGYFNTYYYPVGSRIVLKYRADLRFIQPIAETSYDTMPLDERIFLGGDVMVRGFRPYRLGPTYRHHKDVPRGGLSMQYCSVELTRRIIEDLEGFAFIDAAHLSAKTWEFGRMDVAIGYGFRFKLPIASIPPVTVGMGYPLNAKTRSDVKKFFFSFGANF